MGEASALLLACQKLRPYLLAGIFILKSDSLSISFLHHLQDCKGFFFRLYQTLSGFRFHLHHVQGKKNLADFWSRTRHLPEMSTKEAEALLPIDVDIMAELRAWSSHAMPSHAMPCHAKPNQNTTKPNLDYDKLNPDWEPEVGRSCRPTKPNPEKSPSTNMSSRQTVGPPTGHKHRTQNTEHRTQNTEHKHKTQNTEHRTQEHKNTRTQNTEHSTPEHKNTRTQNTEHRTQNTRTQSTTDIDQEKKVDQRSSFGTF